ncbi:MAG: cache domain-containing protein [Deltaproteobacteria bacterium]|nr:cache domain-containing protein [Deltaproteobacteria bacterium]
MSSNYYNKIRLRYIISVSGVLLVLAGLFCWNSTREYRFVIHDAEKRSSSYAGALKEHAERVFAQSDNTLKQLAAEIEENGGIQYPLQPHFHKLLRKSVNDSSSFNSVFVIDEHGKVVAHSQEYRTKSIDLSDRDYFIHHRDNSASGLFISKPYKSRIDGRWRFNFSRPLRSPDGRFIGLIAVGFDVSYFQKFYKTIDVGKKGRILLSTLVSDVLVVEPFSEKVLLADFKQAVVFKKYLVNASSGTFHTDTSPIDKTARIVSYSKLSALPVVSIVSFDKDEVVAPWLGTLYVQGGIAALLVALAALLSVLFLRQLRRLESSSIKLEEQQEQLSAKADRIMTVVKEWRGTFDAVEDAIMVLDMDRRIISANQASQAIFGKTPEGLIGLHCCQATYDKILPRSDCPFEIMLKTCKRASVQANLHNRWYEIAVDPIFSDIGEIIKAVYIVKNIDDLKKAEQGGQNRAEILERIARGEPLSLLLAFICTAIEAESPGALCSIMLVDDDGLRLLHGAAPNLPDSYNAAVNRTRIGEGIGSCGTAAFRKERVVVEDIDVHPFWSGFRPAREAGLRSCWSEPILSAAGELLGTFAIYHLRPATPGTAEISLIEQASAFAGIAIERSRNEVEREELEHRLSQSQKMEAIGHLAGGVAHDFNNLLTPIILYADMLKRALPNDEKLLSRVDGIIGASHKARDLTQQLLSFGRKQVMQMQVIDLNDAISSFYAILRRTLRESIDINLRLSSQAAVIRADRSKLDQVILNLAINAQDAISDTGEIVIETGQVMIDDEYARLHPGMRAGDYILLSFSDNGCGMNDETLRHIFEPFFTTKPVGHGTGLGLANVYGIVKQHNGYIAAVSTEDSGTIFKIYFPLVDEQPGRSDVILAGPASDYSGSETILLVEDNEMVRGMTAELLEGLGYRVYVGEHPEQALELVRRIPEKIDLLITDVVMPGMNGQQLFERISAERPEIDRVLYMSGYTNNIIVNAGALEEGIHFLQKPFTLDALMAKVRGLLALGGSI